MHQELISLNKDLQKLQNEGFELDVREGYAVVSHIPYLTASQEIRYGELISSLTLSGSKVLKPSDHVIHFSGEYPFELDGKKITAIEHQSINQKMAGVSCNYSFSNKPNNGYADYYEKFSRYIEIISSPAMSKDSKVTAKTFNKIVLNESSNFTYDDTNSSRAGIDSINNKVRNQKIGIIGIGGTGSYILDLIAKTPVSEIHLFDGDDFLQHNAFRAPGAPEFDKLGEQNKKTSHFKYIYSNMHKGIIEHPEFINERNVDKLLKDLDFIFICIDTGEIKRIIVNNLNENSVPFIDTGVAVSICENSLLGTIRNTAILKSNETTVLDRISYVGDDEELYNTNIQIAELNSLSAVFAVIKWKKTNGIYIDNNIKENLVYDTNDGELKYED